MQGTLFGFTEEQVAEFGVTFGVGAFMLFMLFIIGEIAWKSKAGKTGTLVLFFVLAFGMLGFIAKAVIQKIWGI
ncbi:DUF2788 domain-containing protein [Azospira restricta]|uniref:DUF2788 domain-containing protein n=1 Tax=Azospira restricta TaxID=404405 RepID=A0A974SS28_9RHOO|nr:DUF2788 domain-containing protein [Azospira restricta]QRJ65407.1 DUF2788 domain-containing protein [Azospira restricta]